MVREIYGESVQGASHIRSGIVCQDSYKYVKISDEVTVLAVADGHGSDSCPHSKSGSKIATNVFCSVMTDLYKNFSSDMDFFVTYLNREGEIKVAQAIDSEWKRRVWKVHTDNKREKPKNEKGELDKAAVYKQYGTTLLGLMITPTFIFAFQIGDGDILHIEGSEVQPVVQGDKILGTETHSLCKMDAWNKAISMVRMRDAEEGTPYLYLMSTDGFANSYRTEEDFHVTCRDYYRLIKEHGFQSVTANIKGWLNETSTLGCGDDITVVMVYFHNMEVGADE